MPVRFFDQGVSFRSRIFDMAISQLIVCQWEGVFTRETIIENPIWEQIETAIQALNNDDLNDLYLYTNEDVWLCVGGGAGQYFLSSAIGDDVFSTLVDPNKSAEREIMLTVGGQTAEYPENSTHGLAQALAAARDFYEMGGFSSNFNWVNC